MVKEGYKQTEIGVIPEDWELKSVDSIGHLFSGESPSKLKDGNIPYYKVEQLNNSQKYQNQTPYHVYTEHPISAGSIVFPKRGAAIATNKIRILVHDSYFDTNIMSITVDNNQAEAEYLYYLLVRKGLWEIADTTSIPQINNKHINPLIFPFPDKEEQRRIAKAISDIDELISSLEKLIAKKKAIKQGAMQQLLTGKTRLSGFSDTWQKRSIEEIAVFPTATVPTDKIDTRYYIGTDNMIKDKGGIQDNSICIEYEYVREYQKNDILLSNIRPYLKKIWFADRDGGCSNDVIVIRLKESKEINPQLLYFLLSQDSFFDEIMSNAIGTKMPRGDKETIKSYIIAFPTDTKEQDAIVNILLDMDLQIKKFENCLKKNRQLKDGMMQQLLTGKIRLM